MSRRVWVVESRLRRPGKAWEPAWFCTSRERARRSCRSLSANTDAEYRVVEYVPKEVGDGE